MQFTLSHPPDKEPSEKAIVSSPPEVCTRILSRWVVAFAHIASCPLSPFLTSVTLLWSHKLPRPLPHPPMASRNGVWDGHHSHLVSKHTSSLRSTLAAQPENSPGKKALVTLPVSWGHCQCHLGTPSLPLPWQRGSRLGVWVPAAQ